MRAFCRACFCAGLLFLAGCWDSKGERLYKENIRLTNAQAAEIELMATFPSKEEQRKCQERISKIEAEMKSNLEALNKLPIAINKELAEKYRAEREAAQARLQRDYKPIRLKDPDTKR